MRTFVEEIKQIWAESIYSDTPFSFTDEKLLQIEQEAKADGVRPFAWFWCVYNQTLIDEGKKEPWVEPEKPQGKFTTHVNTIDESPRTLLP